VESFPKPATGWFHRKEVGEMKTGFLVCEDYQPDSVKWVPSGEKWSVRRFPSQELVYRLPTELVVPVKDCIVKRLGLEEGAVVQVGDFGTIEAVNDRHLSFWQKRGWGKLEVGKWELKPNRRRAPLAFLKDPTANVLGAIYPIPLGSSALLVGGSGSRKTVWLNHFTSGLSTQGVLTMLVLIDERTHEVYGPSGTELWAASTRQSAGDKKRFADLAYAVARQRANAGVDVVFFLDSLYRLAVLDNDLTESTGALTSGGMRTSVMLEFAQKRMAVVGAAPAEAGGGSLTLVGTNLVHKDDALSKALAGVLRDRADVHLYLRDDGSSVDWTTSFCRKLERVPSVDARAVWQLQDMMKKRVSLHQGMLFAKEREARRRRKDESSIDEADATKMHEQAIALAGDDFSLLVSELGGSSSQEIWRDAGRVLTASLAQHRLPREDRKPNPAPVSSVQPAVVEPSRPSDAEVLAMAKQLAGTPTPASQQPAGTNPANAWERAAQALAQEQRKPATA